MNKIGIMQGRLSSITSKNLDLFPIKDWQHEFEYASKIGLDYIELICDKKSLSENPINNSRGIKEINYLANFHKLSLISVCNNFIIENSIWNDQFVLKQNIDLINTIKPLKLSYFILPLVGKSSLDGIDFKKIMSTLKDILNTLDSANINLLIESNLSINELKVLLKELNHEKTKILFDVGNLSSLGRDISFEIEELGDLIGHIHIKDKDLNGVNVKLGNGIVDFEKLFISLKKINYKGFFTLETTPGINPVKTALNHKNFLLNYL